MTGECLTKINSIFPFTEKLKEYAINPEWQERTSLWDFVSASSEGIGQILYEHGKNFVQNVRDIDTCTIKSLESIADEMDVGHVFDYNLIYPPELEEIMDLLSTNKSYLLTSGYLLENECLSSIYDQLGVSLNHPTFLTMGMAPPVTALTIGSSTSGAITGLIVEDLEFGQVTTYKVYVPQETYISGYMESILREHLIEKTRFYGYEEYSPYYTSACVLVIPEAPDSPYATPELEAEKYRISQQYIGFLDEIVANPEIEWGSTTSAAIIEEGVHVLRNICLKTSYYREILKDTAQRHAMIGSTRAIEKLMYEYILRSFTKQASWDYWMPLSSSVSSIDYAIQLEEQLPNIGDVDPAFRVQVVEYWDYTDYMNISAESALLCGQIGTTPVSSITYSIDTSGNLLSSTVWTDEPVYGTGLCGYVVTGGNGRFWEDPLKAEYLYFTEHTSAEVFEFYENIGLSGTTLADYEAFQNELWDMFATSGLNRYATLSELTGELNSDWAGTPISAFATVPGSGWVTYPTSLTDMHKKYIGTDDGDAPPANIKNEEYPTIAPQPFIWNLIEKVVSIFPKLNSTILFTTQADEDFMPNMVDASGNIIDSWKFPHQEYISYNTYYEDSPNLDYNNVENSEIERDGPFHPDVLSAYLLLGPSGSVLSAALLPPASGDIVEGEEPLISGDISGSVSGDLGSWWEALEPYYEHIEPSFAFENTLPRIDWQLQRFYRNIIDLENKKIFNYSWDQYDNHYMLYKEEDNFDLTGQLWMRYKNHPLPFPLVGDDSTLTLSGDCTLGRHYQQLYTYGGLGINHMANHCYDFGHFKSIMWILGVAEVTTASGSTYEDRLVIFEADEVEYPEPIGDTQFAVVIDSPNIPQFVQSDWRNFVGAYEYNGYLIFVFKTASDSTSVTFKFWHYDKYNKAFEPTRHRTLTIEGTRPVYRAGVPSFQENVFKLSVAEDIISIAYEAETSVDPEYKVYENSIVTIDIPKGTLSDDPENIIIQEWKNIIDPYG